MALLGNQLTKSKGCVMMKTVIENENRTTHSPENNDEYMVLSQLLESLGYKTVQWKRDSEIWTGKAYRDVKNPSEIHIPVIIVSYNLMEQEG